MKARQAVVESEVVILNFLIPITVWREWLGAEKFGRTLILPDFFPYSPGFILYYIQYSKSVKNE
jgi:hypothetical protein